MRTAVVAVASIVFLVGGAAWPTVAADVAPVKLCLAVAEPEVCVGAAGIELRIEIENTSEHAVRIDPHRLAFQVSATRDNQVATTTNDTVALVPGDFRELTPGASYRETVEYKLTDVIWAAAGVVRVSVRYGQFREAKAAYPDLWKGTVESNGVLVRLKDCRAAGK
jgi:hypothetical protein